MKFWIYQNNAFAFLCYLYSLLLPEETDWKYHACMIPSNWIFLHCCVTASTVWISRAATLCPLNLFPSNSLPLSSVRIKIQYTFYWPSFRNFYKSGVHACHPVITTLASPANIFPVDVQKHNRGLLFAKASMLINIAHRLCSNAISCMIHPPKNKRHQWWPPSQPFQTFFGYYYVGG